MREGGREWQFQKDVETVLRMQKMKPCLTWTPWILGLLLHLIPTGVVLVVLAVAWRWERIGAIVRSQSHRDRRAKACSGVAIGSWKMVSVIGAAR